MTDLSGQWSGSYTYPDSFEPTPFQAELRDHDGRISGVVVEPALSWISSGEVEAVINGERRATHVTFTKIYDALDDYPDLVVYEGTIDSDECEIAGTWTIEGDCSGAFVMSRPKPKREKAEAEASATA